MLSQTGVQGLCVCCHEQVCEIWVCCHRQVCEIGCVVREVCEACVCVVMNRRVRFGCAVADR